MARNEIRKAVDRLVGEQESPTQDPSPTPRLRTHGRKLIPPPDSEEPVPTRPWATGEPSGLLTKGGHRILYAGSEDAGELTFSVTIPVTARVRKSLHVDVKTKEPTDDVEFELDYDRETMEAAIAPQVHAALEELVGMKLNQVGGGRMITFPRGGRNFESTW